VGLSAAHRRPPCASTMSADPQSPTCVRLVWNGTQGGGGEILSPCFDGSPTPVSLTETTPHHSPRAATGGNGDSALRYKSFMASMPLIRFSATCYVQA